MTYISSRFVLAFSTLACVGLLSGCATTQINSQWKDPKVTDRLAKGSKVLVLCQSRDNTLRRLCEDQWMVQLGEQGFTVVRAYSLPGIPADGAASADEIRAAASANGARAAVSMQLDLSGIAVVNPGPQLGVGVGGGSGGGYRGGGFSFGGLGISFPVGGATTAQEMAASTTVTNPANGAMLWTGNASTPAESNTAAQVSALTKVTVEALKTAGVI